MLGDIFRDFFQIFDEYVVPLHPLGVIVAVILCGGIGGAFLAARENKRIGVWIVRGAVLFCLLIHLCPRRLCNHAKNWRGANGSVHRYVGGLHSSCNSNHGQQKVMRW